MAEFRLSEPALLDLLEIADYLSTVDEWAAETVIEDLEVAMRWLAEHPGVGHARGDLTEAPDLRFWPVHWFLVVYRVLSRPLEVVRIVHASRDLRHELGDPPPGRFEEES